MGTVEISYNQISEHVYEVQSSNGVVLCELCFDQSLGWVLVQQDRFMLQPSELYSILSALESLKDNGVIFPESNEPDFVDRICNFFIPLRDDGRLSDYRWKIRFTVVSSLLMLSILFYFFHLYLLSQSFDGVGYVYL